MNDYKKMMTLIPQVDAYNTLLNDLSRWWQKVILIGKINSQEVATLIEDMGGTRHKLELLQDELINALVRENIYKLDQELHACSQVAIDILIRNLFERTADVGFLATDDDLRSFLKADSDSDQAKAVIIERLQEYTLKYSVYDEIILLAPNGQVKVHLDQDNPIKKSNDPLIEETIQSDQGYIETFRHSDLQPQLRHSLIYSARINQSDDPKSTLLGVLCLCFRFDNEMESIFENLQQTEQTIAIFDNNRHVIASNNYKQLALGSKVENSTDDTLKTIKFNNNTFFAKSARTSGYQGFYGLLWKGYVLLPAESAFSGNMNPANNSESTFKDSNLFPAELKKISHTATTIIDDLILIVLNGQIISAKRDANEFMPILSEIREIGKKIKGVFDESISNLYSTVQSSLMSSIQFQASLAVDIMDRNLYERANDVRWWSLTTRFCELMSKDKLDVQDTEVLTSTLSYINNLYTVYTNLFIYDLEGKIIAVSNSHEKEKIGTTLPQDGHFKDALSVNDSQLYVVSPFEKSKLYDNRHTYIYLTSIMNKENKQAIGGIGVVFDSEPEFHAMLNDSLPRNEKGHVINGAFALFCDSNQRVISSTSTTISVGDAISVDQAFLNLGNGQHTSLITLFDGSYYAIGGAMSQGYREYKTSENYQNDILALIFVPI